MQRSISLLGAAIALASFVSAQAACFEPSLGTNLLLTDDQVVVQGLNFTFPFNGGSVTSIGICSNGYLWLDNGASTVADFSPTEVELLSQGPRFCPRWCDLYPATTGPGGGVFFNQFPATGTQPARAVITWNQVAYFAFRASFLTMQVQIDANGGILVNYPTSSVDENVASIVGSSAGAVGTPNPQNLSSMPVNLTSSTGYELFNIAPAGTFDLDGLVTSWISTGPGYSIVQALSCANFAKYGIGCQQGYTSFYENFATAAGFDMNGSSLTMINGGTSYTVLPGIAAFIPPTAAATPLTLPDDGAATVALTLPLVFPGGSTSSLVVCSNGHVGAGTGNSTVYNATVAVMLANPATGWYSWRDFNPTAAGSGQVKFEEVGTVACVTWDNVFDYGRTSGGSTMQFQFDEATGNVSMIWVAMDPQGSTAANNMLVAYSPGGASADPGLRDISATLPFNTQATDNLPLDLGATTPPAVGQPFTMAMNNIPVGTNLAAFILSFTQLNPGIDLSFLGMAGCRQYVTLDASNVVLPFGQPSVPFTINIPNQPVYIGFNLYAQAASFSAGFNSLGVVASNGLQLHMGL